MAIIEYNSIVTELSGSVGTVTFSKSATAKVVKVKSVRYISNTKRVQQIKAWQSFCRTFWKKLSKPVINLYTEAMERDFQYSQSRFGKRPLPINFYLPYNTYRIMAGLSILQSFTLPKPKPKNDLIKVWLANNKIWFRFQSDPTANNYEVLIYVSAQKTPVYVSGWGANAKYARPSVGRYRWCQVFKHNATDYYSNETVDMLWVYSWSYFAMPHLYVDVRWLCTTYPKFDEWYSYYLPVE
jgi:hypothetical protein